MEIRVSGSVEKDGGRERDEKGRSKHGDRQEADLSEVAYSVESSAQSPACSQLEGDGHMQAGPQTLSGHERTVDSSLSFPRVF